MPSIRDDNTVKAIAREYIANGRNKTQALLKVGYKAKYAETTGIGVVYRNARVIAEIGKLEAKLAKDNLYTVKHAQDEYEEARELAKTIKAPASMVSATGGKARLYGLDRQVIDDSRTKEPTLTREQEIEQLELRLATLKRATGVALALAE